MLKYLYISKTKSLKNYQFTNVIEHKLINKTYNNKFYIRSYSLNTNNILILDNNSKFFLINRNNIRKYCSLFKEKMLIGKSLQLNTFEYNKKNSLKLVYYIGNKGFLNFSNYLKTLYIFKQTIINRINFFWPLVFIKKGRFKFIFNGIKGIIPKKNYIHFKKFYKTFKTILLLRQKFQIVLHNSEKILLKILFLNLLKTNKLIHNKHKYKNQYKNLNPVFKALPFNTNKLNYANIKTTFKKGSK